MVTFEEHFKEQEMEHYKSMWLERAQKSKDKMEQLNDTLKHLRNALDIVNSRLSKKDNWLVSVYKWFSGEKRRLIKMKYTLEDDIEVNETLLQWELQIYFESQINLYNNFK